MLPILFRQVPPMTLLLEMLFGLVFFYQVFGPVFFDKKCLD